MKKSVGSTLSIIAIVILSITWFSPVSDYDIAKTQRERIEILKLAENSSDPAILKQAEVVRIDIERDYNHIIKKDVISEKSEDLLSSEDLSEIYRVWKISLMLALPTGFILGIAFALYKKYQFSLYKKLQDGREK
ncbi:hypothetical protein [Neisseria elongata]